MIVFETLGTAMLLTSFLPESEVHLVAPIVRVPASTDARVKAHLDNRGGHFRFRNRENGSISLKGPVPGAPEGDFLQ